jgi:hypothetical protein
MKLNNLDISESYSIIDPFTVSKVTKRKEILSKET